MKHIGLFEGIGGFSLAASWMDWKTIAWCEWNLFGQQVLKYHFPKATGHGDITKTDFTIYRGKCDIITGGFPCQPYSHAGKRLGKEDERHLWPEMLRAIREIQPAWVVGENVSGLISWNGGLVFHEVQTDLEIEGYEVFPVVLPACAVNAPHRRDRVWFIAYSESNGDRRRLHRMESEDGSQREPEECGQSNNEHWNDGTQRPTTNADIAPTKHTISTGRDVLASNNWPTTHPEPKGFQRTYNNTESPEGIQSKFTKCNTWNAPNPTVKRLERTTGQSEGWDNLGFAGYNKPNEWQNFPTQPPVCSRNDGISAELVGITVSKHRNESIKAYGNAIVPQVALQIFKVIEVMRTDSDKQ